MRRRALTTIVPAAVALAACSGGDGGASAVARDSAGVQIVENQAPRWSQGDEWTLSETPELLIGVLEGPSEQQLFRVTGAHRLHDGRVAVANGGTNEIRFYDAEGRYLSTAGRQGEGPGEFAGMGALYPYSADSLLVMDFRLRRLSVLSATGKFARNVMLPTIGERSFPQPVAVFDDGTLLVRTGRIFGPGEVKPGLNRDPTTLLRMQLDAGGLDTLGTFPGLETFLQTFPSGNVRGFRVTTTMFGRGSSVAALGNRFYVGATDSYEIGVYSGDGTLERLIRLQRPNRPVTQEDLDRYKRAQLENVTDDNERRMIETSLAEMPVPSTMPAYGAFTPDAEGNLWVMEYRPTGEFHTRWTVFDPEGQMLGVVQGPERFTAYEIGRDYILGRRTDELDVEHVELYRIDKGKA